MVEAKDSAKFTGVASSSIRFFSQLVGLPCWYCAILFSAHPMIGSSGAQLFRYFPLTRIEPWNASALLAGLDQVFGRETGILQRGAVSSRDSVACCAHTLFHQWSNASTKNRTSASSDTSVSYWN